VLAAACKLREPSDMAISASPTSCKGILTSVRRQRAMTDTLLLIDGTCEVTASFAEAGAQRCERPIRSLSASAKRSPSPLRLGHLGHHVGNSRRHETAGSCQ